jgi:hypothetical protein
VADHLVPNQVLGFFEFFREREREVFCFQRLAKAFIGADSRGLNDAPFAAYARFLTSD